MTVFCLVPRLSFVSSSLSGLLLLCRISLVFFPCSLILQLYVYWGFPPSRPSSFHLSGWRLVFLHGSSPSRSPSSMALLLPGRLPPPLPLAITGAFSLSLLAFPLFLRCYSSLYCPLLRLWCRSTCLHDLLLLGVSCSFFAWVPGRFVPSAPCCLSAVLLSSWDSRLLRSRLPPSSLFLLEFLSCAPPCLSLAISFLQFFFLWSPSRRLGVCLPWLLSLPFQCATISFCV